MSPNRLADELHDGPIQNLIGAKMLLESMQAGSSLDDSTAAELRQIHDLLAEAIGDLRSIMHRAQHTGAEGRPVSLSESLNRLVRRFSIGLQIDCHIEGAADQLPVDMQNDVMQIVQAAVGNVVQHSRARRANVSVVVEPKQLLVEVADDGDGIDSAPEARAHGWSSMRNRCARWGGELRIESPADGGVCVKVILPRVARPA